MRPPDQQTTQFSDALRIVIYPLIPIFVVVCTWALGYASAMESKVRRELSPLNERITIQTPTRTDPDAVLVSAADRN